MELKYQPPSAIVRRMASFNESPIQSQPVFSDAPSHRKRKGRHRSSGGPFSSERASDKLCSSVHHSRPLARCSARARLASSGGGTLCRDAPSLGNGPPKFQRQGGLRVISGPVWNGSNDKAGFNLCYDGIGDCGIIRRKG